MNDISLYPAPIKKNVRGWPWEPDESVCPELERYPKISLVVPSYFRGDYLEETLRSIFLQGYPNLELIIMDGGSTDATTGILEYYNEYISYWESKKDKGQSDGINKGFKRCTGEIITFQNSDDYYMPGVFHVVAKMYLDKPGAGVFAGGFYFMDHKSRPIGEVILPHVHITTPGDLTAGPAGAYRMHQCAIFFSNAALDDVGRYVRDDLDYTMDRELLYRIVRKYSVVLTDQMFGAFRQHPDSKSTNSIRPFASEWARLHREFKNGNHDEDSKRESMARFRLYRGEIQYAKLTDSKIEKIAALLNALKYRPGALFSRAYIRLCYKVIFNKMNQD